jgi:hypothetical protein
MVLKIVDRLFAWLLVLGGLLHAYGSLKSYEAQTPELVWSLAGSFAAILLAAVNLLRADRPSDRTLAWVSFIACLCWVAIRARFRDRHRPLLRSTRALPRVRRVRARAV